MKKMVYKIVIGASVYSRSERLGPCVGRRHCASSRASQANWLLLNQTWTCVIGDTDLCIVSFKTKVRRRKPLSPAGTALSGPSVCTTHQRSTRARYAGRNLLENGIGSATFPCELLLCRKYILLFIFLFSFLRCDIHALQSKWVVHQKLKTTYFNIH